MLSYPSIYRIALLFYISLSILVIVSDGAITLDFRAPFTEIAEAFGHPAEHHWVITEDGYNITIFHIPGDKTRPVFLVHGYTAGPDCFIVRGNGSLAITLANKGYDVWVVSLRGTRYSSRHIDPAVEKDSRRYYNFTFYEQGIHDIPKSIDYILERTQQKRLTAIGYSIGAMVFYILGSEKPEYNDKISVLISLGPICFFKNIRGSTRLAFEIGSHTNLSVVVGPPSSAQLGTPLTQVLCGKVLPPYLAYIICMEGFVFPSVGRDKEGMEPQFMPMFFGHIDANVAKIVLHSAQIFKRDKFAKFDYGEYGNKVMYNSPVPPEFDLSKVTMKVALLMGQADLISTVKDAERLRSLLPNVVHYEVLQFEKFNHLDFAYGRHMPSNLFPSMLPLVETYTSGIK